MKPSLGRIVLARVDPLTNNGSDEAPAMITRVWSEQPDGRWLVNLRITLDRGTAPMEQHNTSVYLHDEKPTAEALAAQSSSYVVAWWPPRV